MATLQTLGVDSLSLRGSSGEYHRLSRFFRSKVEADNALASGDYVPVGGVVNAVLVGGEGILIYNEITNSFDNLSSGLFSYVDEKISSLVDDLDTGDLDSIAELAAAVNNNPNFWSDVESQLAGLVSDVSTEIQARTAGDTVLTSAVAAKLDSDAATVRTLLGIGEYADDAAAGTDGVTSGAMYYNTTSSDYRQKS